MSATTKPRIAILGAGPAGLGAAFNLARRSAAEVTVLERNAWVGGNAGSFELAGLRVDFGSHRLHPACDPTVLRDIRDLLGPDLLKRPRHGRIRLRGRWIHFPLKPLDLALRLPPSFALGVATDLASRVAQRRAKRPSCETFATVLERGLGRTICRDFYFPYARKIWGLDPDELSATQAYRRIAAGSIGKMLRKVIWALPGMRSPERGHYLYPRRGYGQISEAYADASRKAGADVQLGAGVRQIALSSDGSGIVRYEQGGVEHCLEVDQVWSTIPITVLARMLEPAPPAEYLEAANRLGYRAMILIYLVLEQERFAEFDAYYFPEADLPISRVSEPKNFSAGEGPPGITVLCAELPCDPTDPEWTASDEDLGKLARELLASAGLPIRASVRQVATARLRQAYPVYRIGFEATLERLDRWLDDVDGLLTFGRQGLFSHDNLHHALYVGYCAADCLDDGGRFDRRRWAHYRRIFETHVVED